MKADLKPICGFYDYINGFKCGPFSVLRGFWRNSSIHHIESFAFLQSA